jgi:hypothetical protein
VTRTKRRPPWDPGPRAEKGRKGRRRGGEDRQGEKEGELGVPFSAKSWGYSAFQYILPDLTPETNRCASRFATTASALRASAAPVVRAGAAQMRRKRCFPHCISPQTGLYTGLQSAPPRALRHSFPSGTCNADSTLRQLRRAWFRPAESLQGSLRSPIGIDAAGKSTKHDDAANLVTQACSGHPLGSSECRI